MTSKYVKMVTMNKRFDLIVFDWDGTLVDSTSHIVDALRAACQDVGSPVPTRDEAAYVIGLGLADAVRYIAPQLDDAGVQQLVGRYRYHFLARDHEQQPFAGIEALLASLRDRGYGLAIATGKARAGLTRALGQCSLGAYFASTRCADESFSKPHPAMLLELMQEFAVPADRVLMIGDTTHDILMAQNASAAALAVSYGAHPRRELLAAAPLALVDDVMQLTEWLACHA